MTHASGDLYDDAWAVHHGEKLLCPSGQWVIEAQQIE